MKKEKRFLSALLALCMVLSLLTGTATAAGVVASGECGAQGDNLTWNLVDGVLTISGTGEMPDWYLNGNDAVPWFDYIQTIRQVTIGDGVTNIGEWTFSYHGNLTNITIPDGVTSIGEGAFCDCTSLTAITIPNSVSSIGYGAFNGCTSLTAITLSNSVTSIGNATFWGCTSLTGITIPDSVTSIGYRAFYKCESLTNITIPDSVISIGESAFEFCGLTNITIPDSVTSIGNFAFAGCRGLTEITIPDSVTSIGSWNPFVACTGLREITVDESNSEYTSVEGVLFTKNIDTILCYPAGKPGNVYAVPNSVTSIGIDAFGWCTSLTDITIPDSVTSIGDGAFIGCAGLREITIPDSVTSIAGQTFYDCISLTSVTIPAGVTSIDDQAFYACRSLRDVYYSGTKAEWRTVTIGEDNAPLRSAKIHYSDENIGGGDSGTGGGSTGGGGSTPTPSEYSVSAPGRVTGGTVKVSPANAAEGSKVTITVKPDSGYEVGSVTVTDKDGKRVAVTDAGGGSYTFTMPKSAVDVKVEFVQEVVDTPPAPTVFDDVRPDAYYADAVAWAVERGITTGTGDAAFSPNASCTRAQMVTFLWRAAGSPKAAAGSPFTDVPAGSYYYDAVLWAVEQGITSGTSAATFSPNDTCTRSQAVTFLYRAEGSPSAAGGSFSDVQSGAYYADAVAWAVANGITNGTGRTTFSPNSECTRAQTVTFLYRAFGE